MIMSSKKKPSTLIVAKLREGKPEEMSEAPVEQDDSIAKDSAAEELLAAIHSKDAKALKEAFSSMLELCGEAEEASESEEAE